MTQPKISSLSDVHSGNPIPVSVFAGDGSGSPGLGLATVYTLLDAVIANGTSAKTAIPKGKRTAQAKITGTGAVSASVALYGSNNATDAGLLLFTFPLSGTTTDVSLAPNPGEEIPEFPYHYATLSGISGTGAAVTFTLAV